MLDEEDRLLAVYEAHGPGRAKPAVVLSLGSSVCFSTLGSRRSANFEANRTGVLFTVAARCPSLAVVTAGPAAATSLKAITASPAYR